MVTKFIRANFQKKYRRLNSCRQPKAKPLDQKLELTPAKPQPKPAQATAASGEHDPSALLCLTSTPTPPPRKPAHAIPPHTSQAAQHRTAPPLNMHGPASSKLSFEP